MHGSCSQQFSSVLFMVLVTEEASFEPITTELLRNDKQFVKLIKKQQKDLESVTKHHVKEKSQLQKQHCMVIDKMVAAHEKERLVHERLVVERQAEKNSKQKRRLAAINYHIYTSSV